MEYEIHRQNHVPNYMHVPKQHKGFLSLFNTFQYRRSGMIGFCSIIWQLLSTVYSKMPVTVMASQYPILNTKGSAYCDFLNNVHTS